jgi:hypothetical protein
VTCLWALDVDSGSERLLADPGTLLGVRHEHAPEPGTEIVAYAADRSGGLVAFTLAGDLWTVEVAEGPVADPRPDPGGRRIAYVCGGVGIRGWSFGGSLAALAVLRRPDVFHAAVAGAPVTDQRLHNSHGASASSAIPTSSPNGTRPARWCARRRS